MRRAAVVIAAFAVAWWLVMSTHCSFNLPDSAPVDGSFDAKADTF